VAGELLEITDGFWTFFETISQMSVTITACTTQTVSMTFSFEVHSSSPSLSPNEGIEKKPLL
jgi:hypothetical protein